MSQDLLLNISMTPELAEVFFCFSFCCLLNFLQKSINIPTWITFILENGEVYLYQQTKRKYSLASSTCSKVESDRGGKHVGNETGNKSAGHTGHLFLFYLIEVHSIMMSIHLIIAAHNSLMLT